MTYQNDSREAHKERLRSNLITRSESGKDARRPSPAVYIAVLLALIGAAFGIYWSLNMSVSTGYRVSWERGIEGASKSVETFRDYRSFAGGIIKYTKDGAEYTDRKGNVVWERSYQLNAPVIDVCDKYAVIGDQGGTQLYIFSSSEMTGSSETLLPISLVRVADNGVVYTVLNDSSAEYITAFRQDGSAIDLSVKSILKGDGYPFAVDVSPDGTELITSYIGIENGQLTNNIVFRNFGSIGQNEDARRIVGGFKDEFAGHLAGYVHFSTNEYSQAFYDGGVVFFSTEVLNSPEILSKAEFEEKIETVVSSGSIEALILAPDSSEASRKLLIFDPKGRQLADIALEQAYNNLCVSKDAVIVQSGNELTVYGRNGVVRGRFEFAEGDITGIVGGGTGRDLYVLTGTAVYRIKY